ncbi:hypothetical protein LC035_06620 [Bacillus stratosphericus]|nr:MULTISPECIES: hypothetical protein [Bacillus]MCA1013331.1 hypothetical protein [Bacillus stratosphericus]GLF90886.1 hypothetical protein Saga11_21450 [Bacillus safensis]MCA2384066.1 hypothetical protein [Bacillus stratosphericus]MCA2398171.1 hypothetical protein [Bacillus stratosphericus]MEC1010672.1 hypothetical protein [Bacillus altitudinis]
MQHYLDDVIETIRSYVQRVTEKFFELGLVPLSFLAIIILLIFAGTR